MNLKILVAVLSVILAALLVLVPILLPGEGTPAATDAYSAGESLQTSSSVTQASTGQGQTVPSSQPGKQPETQPVAQPETQPATQPALKHYSDDPAVNAFINARLSAWICPVKDAFGEVVGSRTFASGRSGGKRAHAGLDFVAPHGTKVYAVTSGTVQRVAPFYYNTVAVEVKNDDGSVLRYCEIATDLKAGDHVKQGDIIGTILRADSGTEMLHMEVYMGNEEGMLTQSGNTVYKYVSAKNFMRRSDLLDPTFLKDLPQ